MAMRICKSTGTGVLFDEQTPEALYQAIERLEGLRISSAACLTHAQSFDEAVFRAGITTAIAEARSLARAYR